MSHHAIITHLSPIADFQLPRDNFFYSILFLWSPYITFILNEWIGRWVDDRCKAKWMVQQTQYPILPLISAPQTRCLPLWSSSLHSYWVPNIMLSMTESFSLWYPWPWCCIPGRLLQVLQINVYLFFSILLSVCSVDWLFALWTYVFK